MGKSHRPLPGQTPVQGAASVPDEARNAAARAFFSYTIKRRILFFLFRKKRMGVLKLPGFPGTPVPTEKGPSPRRSRKPSAFAALSRAPGRGAPPHSRKEKLKNQNPRPSQGAITPSSPPTWRQIPAALPPDPWRSTAYRTPSRHCDSRPLRVRQSRRFLETGSLFPPLAALRRFPLPRKTRFAGLLWGPLSVAPKRESAF